MYLNTINLAGFAGKDAEQKFTPNGTAYVRFSLATKTSWRNEEGEWQERTEWHQIVAWGKLAERSAGIRKGTHLFIQGELRYREYPKDDVKHVIAEITADTIRSLERARADDQGAAPASQDPA